MESSTSKTQVIKPLFLKAGIPLALTIAGFVYAKIIARRNIIPAANTSSLESKVCSFKAIDSNDEFKDIEGPNFLKDDEEILGLRSRIEELQKRELDLENQFLEYYAMKEQESMLMEAKNILVIEAAYDEFLGREISSIEAENEIFQNLVVEYLKLVEHFEFLKLKNGLLKGKVKKLSRKLMEQSRIIREKNLKIEAAEEEILRCYDTAETRSSVIKELEDQVKELQSIVNSLQEEKNQLFIKLNAAENSASSTSKIDAEVVKMEEYNKVVKELEELGKDRANETVELTYLRWSNACLRHELMRTNHEEERQNHLELEINGNGEIKDCRILEQQEDGISVLAQKESCVSSSRRKKLLHKIKKWVEGNEAVKPKLEQKEKQEIKCFGRLSVSEEAEEGHVIQARRSCSSA